jgi:predicted nucleic acid-binding protein
MDLLVVDASVSLAWVMPDEGLTAEAEMLMSAVERQKVRLIAPSLWAYEVTRGLHRAARRGRTDRSSAWRALEEVFRTEVALYSPGKLIRRAWWLTVPGRINLYDACYLALAQAKGCHCLTADRKLLDAAADTGLVRWIGDYQ